MNNDNLRKALEANRFYYARRYEAMRPEHEKIRLEQKQILARFYNEVAEMETRLRAMEAELGYKYSPNAHKFNPYHDDLGRFASGPGGGDANDSGSSNTGNDNSNPSVLPKISVPGPNGQPVNQANIFVGGAMDQSGFHNVQDSTSLNNTTYGDNYYATHSDLDKIDQQISQLPDGQTVNLVGHSWGGDTAAQAALDNPGRINTLVTVDPVTTFGSTPNFDKLNSSVGTWVDINATGNPNSSMFGDITNGNLVAGAGAWNNGPNGHADVFISAPYNHADFNQMMNYPSANGGPSAQQILNGGK